MPADACPVAAAPPAPPAIASERHEPERAAVQAAASPAEAERLGNRIAELAARIQAATYELLVLIREFDAAGAWSGFASCAVWLSWRTGLAPGPAREHVRVAQALAGLPKLSDAMRRGRVSYSKVRAVTRVATPETEQALLDVALAGTATHVERVVRAWRRTDRAAEQAEDRERQAERTLRTWVDDDGMVVVRGRLTPEAGSAFRRALEAVVAADGGGTVEGAGGTAERTDAVDEAAGVERSLGQRQADALGRLAECALAGGLDRGTAGDRYQVVLHVDAETLAEDAGGDVPAGTRGPVRRGAGCPGPRTARGQAALAEDGGIRVGQETARRIACDAATVTMRHGADGGVLDVGRRTRTVSPALRRALAARDGQCRFPELRGPALRCAPRPALGRGRGDGAREPGAAVPAAPPGGARRRLPRAGGRRRGNDVPAARRAAAAGGAGGPGLGRAGAGARGPAVGGGGDRHRRGDGAALAGRAAGPRLGPRRAVAPAGRRRPRGRRSRGNVRTVTIGGGGRHSRRCGKCGCRPPVRMDDGGRHGLFSASGGAAR